MKELAVWSNYSIDGYTPLRTPTSATTRTTTQSPFKSTRNVTVPSGGRVTTVTNPAQLQGPRSSPVPTTSQTPTYTNPAQLQGPRSSPVPTTPQTPTYTNPAQLQGPRSSPVPTTPTGATTAPPPAPAPSASGGGSRSSTQTQTQPSAQDRVAGHISYFGSPEAYAQAIQQRGDNLADPEAAAAFRQMYPHLFQAQEQQQVMAAGFSEAAASILSGFDQLISEYKSGTNEMLALASTFMSNMLSTLSQLEAQVLGQIRQQMGADDPAVANALRIIREEVSRQRQELLESMNARGLLQSGIVLEMEDRLNRNALTAQEQVIVSRLADLQAQLNNAIMSFAQQRIAIMSQGGQMQFQAMAQGLQGLSQLGTSRLSAATQLYGMELQAREAAADRELRERLSREQFGIEYARLDMQQRQHVDNMALQYARMSHESALAAQQQRLQQQQLDWQRQYQGGLLDLQRQQLQFDTQSSLLPNVFNMAQGMLAEIQSTPSTQWGNKYRELVGLIDNSPYPPDIKNFMKSILEPYRYSTTENAGGSGIRLPSPNPYTQWGWMENVPHPGTPPIR